MLLSLRRPFRSAKTMWRGQARPAEGEGAEEEEELNKRPSGAATAAASAVAASAATVGATVAATTFTAGWATWVEATIFTAGWATWVKACFCVKCQADLSST